MSNQIHKGAITFHAKDESAWREWLFAHADELDAVWLEIYKKASGIASITFDQALDQALCFGWIDSKANRKDAESYYQFFTKRNPKSNWSKINKERIQRLTDDGLMTTRGLEMVALAKRTGTWDALNDVENLIIPDDLAAHFEQFPNALDNWQQFPRSIKRGILEWIFNAKRPSTRLKRIRETAHKAAMNVRANQYTG